MPPEGTRRCNPDPRGDHNVRAARHLPEPTAAREQGMGAKDALRSDLGGMMTVGTRMVLGPIANRRGANRGVPCATMPAMGQ